MLHRSSSRPAHPPPLSLSYLLPNTRNPSHSPDRHSPSSSASHRSTSHSPAAVADAPAAPSFLLTLPHLTLGMEILTGCQRLLQSGGRTWWPRNKEHDLGQPVLFR